MIALANATEPRYRTMVLLATFAALRWSERLGPQPRDIQVDRRIVTVRRVIVEPVHGKKFVGPLQVVTRRRRDGSIFPTS